MRSYASVFGRDGLPTSQSLRRGYLCDVSVPKCEGTPKRSDGGLPVRERPLARSQPFKPEQPVEASGDPRERIPTTDTV
jgi:hypothetical protein